MIPERVRAQLELLPDYLSSHIVLTATALLAGLAITMPLAAIVLRVRRLQGPALAVASVIQTAPSLALLALMVPLLGRIGFVPAAIALTLYSVLPILRNTVTGVQSVDPAIVEAARGVGMTQTQMLLRVQIPIASPVIIAGVRTATVWVVGIATLATPVGAESLGNYIFSGLQTRNNVAVLIGCGAAAALALTLDGLIRVLEVSVRRRSRALALTAMVGLFLVLGGGLAPTALGALRGSSAPIVRVGAKTFTEQYILSRVLSRRLEEGGFDARRVTGLGSTVAFEALATDGIDVYVEYTGTIWSNLMREQESAPPEEVLAGVTKWLEDRYGVQVLGALGFENAYRLAMREDHAERLGVRTVDDLVPHAPDLSIGSDYEFFARPDWTNLQRAYGIRFGAQRSFDSSIMYSAVATGGVDVITAFTTDSRILAYDLRLLDDTRRAFPPYDAVVLLSPRAARDERIVAALTPLLGTISDEMMMRANGVVDEDRGSVGEAARWLDTQIRGAGAGATR